MPNAFTKFLATGDAEARRMLGSDGVFSARGRDYAGAAVILAPMESDLVYAAGGAEVRVKATATVRKADFGQRMPAEGDAVTLRAGKFYIVAVGTTDADPLIHLTLAS